MAKSSAAQEPSMDEILASIRKIIESGDERPDGSQAAAARSMVVLPEVPLQDEPPIEAEDASEHAAAAELPAIAVSDFPVADEPAEAAEAPNATIAFLDSDFTDLKLELEQEFSSGLSEPLVVSQPMLRAASADSPFQSMQRPEEIERAAVEWPLRSDGRHAALRAAAAVAGDRQAARPAVPAEPVAERPPVVDAEPAVSGPPHRPANSDDPRMRDFREAILRDSERPPLVEPLLSSRSGDLVSASFEELDRAIRDGQLRSMEEMAEEMMRPMLQEWLDDNLPRIVERLVREEIERVARGGR